MTIETPDARAFYEAEARRGGWSVRQLDRRISTMFYERTALSRNKAAMLKKGEKPRRSDIVTAEEEIRDSLVLEFLGLKLVAEIDKTRKALESRRRGGADGR